MYTGTKTHCARGTPRGTAPKAKDGRCWCVPCRQYKKSRKGCGARRFDPALQHRKKILKHALDRAREHKIPFDITIDDIVVPEYCPVLGIKLERGKGKASFASPTLDRMIPALGYVRGNITIMSNRANSVKNDASAEELMKVALWVSRHGV